VSGALASPHPAAEPSLAAVLDAHAIHSVYQPVVDLYRGETVAYEALARGPAGSALDRPDRLFEAARFAALEAEVEWECQLAALEGVLESGLRPGQALFVNLESKLLGATRPARLAELMDRALDRFPVFVELTERALASRPAHLLAAVRGLRRLGVGVALDDVGADPRSVALMPFLEPDLIKLDISVVQGDPAGAAAETLHAVGAEAERTGALIVAEGIETDAHLRTALALGARYGQGWMFGSPQALPAGVAVGLEDRLPAPRDPDRDGLASPFEIVARHRPIRRADKRLLLALSREIEASAGGLGPAAVIMSSFQANQCFSPATAATYARLADGASLVAALAAELASRPVRGVHGAGLRPEDPVRSEWDVTLLGPHSAIALVARDLGDGGSDMDRRFDFAVTHDRTLVIAAAHALMGRLAGA